MASAPTSRQAVKALTGWDPRDLVGRVFREMIHPADVAEVEMAMRALRAGSEGGTLEYREHKRDGEYYWAEGSLRVYRDPATGRPIGFLNLVRDITERKRSEEHLQSAYRAMESLVVGRTRFTGIRQPPPSFDEALTTEWRRALREGDKLSPCSSTLTTSSATTTPTATSGGDSCLKQIKPRHCHGCRPARPGDLRRPLRRRRVLAVVLLWHRRNRR